MGSHITERTMEDRTNPDISVVMSVYNGERFLEQAIDSVLGQTVQNFELIVVDDGSKDSTPEILNRYLQRDPRVVLISQENSGVAASLNRAIACARAELVAHLDADDRALPNWLEEQRNFLEAHPSASVVSSFANLIDADGNRLGVSKNPIDVDRGRRELRPDLFLDVIHSSVLMKKAALLDVGCYRQHLPYLEDRDLWGRLVTSGHMILGNPKLLVDYRVHSGSITVRKRDDDETFFGRGINVNVVRRLRGEDELDLEGVKAWFESRPLGEKIGEARRVKAGFYFREAARHYAERRWLRLACTLGLAAAIRPLYVVQRMAKKVGPLARAM